MPIARYTEDNAAAWDAFVLNDSVNGNFLQSRAFLAYHPEGRFQDHSLIYTDPKGNLRAVIPAAEVDRDGIRTFVAHPGSTYGGIVLDAKSCSAKRVQEIIDDLHAYLEAEGFQAVDLRFPPDFMWKNGEGELMEYMLRYNGYGETTELTTYVDFDHYKDAVTSNFSQGKRTNINNGIKCGLTFRVMETEQEARQFYDMLCENLKKYGVSPVHTFEELWQLHTQNLEGKTQLLGVFDADGMLVASGWIFLFENLGTIHTQYLCANNELRALSPMTFLYYSVIQHAKDLGYRYVSWGISTEDKGKVLNWGLTESKEHFGSLHGVHRSYGKSLQ